MSDPSILDGGAFVLSRSSDEAPGDCLLRPSEVADLDLDVDLVSMSSCSSYNYLERGRTMAESLKSAKQFLRTYVAPDGRRPYEHPAYWSPFVLVGSGT